MTTTLLPEDILTGLGGSKLRVVSVQQGVGKKLWVMLEWVAEEEVKG